MSKGESSMASTGPEPTAPPPSPSALPPSYEEAIAQSMNMTNPSINAPPYPTGTARLAMPTPHGQPSVHMPTPGYPTSSAAASFEPQTIYTSNNGSNRCILPAPAYPITSEVRVVRRPGTYILAPSPVKMQCPSCLADIKTSTVSDHQPMAHICCLILCVLGCCLCSCLPYCMSAFMTVHHFCPSCKVYIGTWKGFDSSRRLMAVRV